MPARPEVLGDRSVGGEELLSVARGLNPLHVSLALARRLVGVLGAVVQIPVLAMFHPREALALGGSIAFQFIGDEYPRYRR